MESAHYSLTSSSSSSSSLSSSTGDAGEAASRVAGYPGVRAALLDLQQAFAAQAGGAVLESGALPNTIQAPPIYAH